MRISVLIPAFNEERTIAEVLERVLEADADGGELEIVVVDDASTDGTARLVTQTAAVHENVLLIRGRKNVGKAGAIRLGLASATGDVVLIQDADVEYSPSDFPALLEPFGDPSVTAVYGSRFLATPWPQGMRPLNWLANRVFTWTTNRLFGSEITDEGTGYKLFRRELLIGLPLRAEGFSFCPDVTAQWLLSGKTIREVPVSYRARTRKEGKKPGFRDGWLVLRTLLGHAWSGARAARSEASPP